MQHWGGERLQRGDANNSTRHPGQKMHKMRSKPSFEVVRNINEQRRQANPANAGEPTKHSKRKPGHPEKKGLLTAKEWASYRKRMGFLPQKVDAFVLPLALFS